MKLRLAAAILFIFVIASTLVGATPVVGLEGPAVSVGDVSVVEGNSPKSRTVNFPLTLSEEVANEVVVKYRVVADTATADEDFKARVGTAKFPAGAVSRQIGVSVFGDTVAENDETFKVELYEVVGAETNKEIGVGTIVDDDEPPATTTTTAAPTTTTTAPPTTTTTVPTAPPSSSGWQMTRTWYEANTGPVGELTVHPGSLTTSRDGQVIENLHITGDLIVGHSGVTVRNCRVDGTGTSESRVRIQKGETGTVIERCEIGYDGAPIVGNGIAGSDAASRGVIVRNTFIHRSNDGVKLGTNGRVEYSLIVLTEITAGAHSDGIQMMDGSGQRVYRNWFVQGNGSGSGFNANVWISQNMGLISDVVIEENHFAGSGFQVKLGSGSNVLARNNVHSPDHTFGPYKDYVGGLTVQGATYDDGTRIG